MVETPLHRGAPLDAPPGRLKRRTEFLSAAKGGRFHLKGFTLQAGERELGERADASLAPPRFGFTVTKKVGGAVVRNRIRRRLKEALRLAGPLPARPGCDYVVIARIEALTFPFAALQADLRHAIARVGVTARNGQKRGARRKDAARPGDAAG